jgi:hypothetical protein
MERKFDLTSIQSLDEVEIEIKYPGTDESTGWFITLAGPGHPKTIEMAEIASQKNLHRQRMIDQAQINGRKYKAPEIDVETDRRQNLEGIIGRVIGWRGLYVGGEEVPYSAENAQRILSDRRNDKSITQVINYILDDQSFMKRSEAT